MIHHARQDETTEWLNYLQPEGLVVGANVLRERELTPVRQTPLDSDAARLALGLGEEASRADDKRYILGQPWTFLETVLGWPAKLVAGSPGGPPVPADLARTAPEHETLLAPDMAVLWHGDPQDDAPTQALVSLYPTLDPDGRNQFGVAKWEASPHQRLVRHLQETRIGVGILVARNTLRLVYAPRGETPGWISWPLAALGRPEGRPMLAGLKLCLGRNAFFTGAPETRLRPLLKASREAQNEVSEKLSGQVLAALYELLRGLQRAAPERIEAIAESEPHHLYEGLLTCLMRLVFLLYAEDRDLLPSSRDPLLKTLWESGYSIKTLYARLLADEALNPDTMDERRGAWGQLLAVFRLIHDGHGGWVARRGGKLFDPDAFPFLEGRETGTRRKDGQALPVSDKTILGILHELMTVEGRSLSGEKIRERLSYRSLDVQSIGSVYETVMGFTARRATESMIALRDEKKLPAFVGLAGLLAEKPADRQKWLKEHSVKLSAKQAKGVKEAGDEPALLEAFGGAVDVRASPGGSPLGDGAPYLQPTEERRRSGAHYTPRLLTEPIVRHALEPAFERIGADASPEAVLSLKVLDPACGSGAFLVEACRQIGARLEQAWDMHQAEKPAIPADEDETIHACRLVAQRCLYGVDRNPMAVDLARLSLWLATLAREHEFSFLDHALKAGDSLVGLMEPEIQAAHWDASKPGLPLFQERIKKAAGEAFAGREAIRNAADDVRMEAQAARFSRVQDASELPRIVGDAVISAFFSADKPRAREIEREKVESWIAGGRPEAQDLLTAKAHAFRSERGWRPFHWEVEFPEVFARDNPGFDAIVGNPPFAGKNTISATSGPRYLLWLQHLHEGAHGNADLIAHFFRRAFVLLRDGGAFGLIATNTIGQGDTRASGLGPILLQGGTISRAVKRLKWPGEAAVVVSVVHIAKDHVNSFILNGTPVSRISAYLVEGDMDNPPASLVANEAKGFSASFLLGMGFTFDDNAAAKGEAESISDMERLIARHSSNADRIKPYIGGEEINNSPTHAHHRYAIDFFDFPLRRETTPKRWSDMTERERRRCRTVGIVPLDYADPVAADWPDLLAIVEARVKPARDPQNRKALRERWWQYAEKRPGLYRAIRSLERVIAMSRISPHLSFCLTESARVYSIECNVFAFSSASPFAVLQSRAHEIWARFFSSSMKDDLRYAPSDCFETFPFPPGYASDASLEAVGQAYHDHRADLMVKAGEGMTKTYNRFHKESEHGAAIETLRDLHDRMDRTVLRAYGWNDLADTLRPQFLTPETEDDHTYQGRYFWPAEQRDIVLSRLLALNAERHAEEVAVGVAPAAGRRARDEDEDDGQDTLGLD
jgi:hypothetical protein